MRTFKQYTEAISTLIDMAGLASLITGIIGIVYIDRRLHKTAHDNYKFGPARHLNYFSDVIHRASRDIDKAALNAYNSAASEDAIFYDSLKDAHDEQVAYHPAYKIPDNGPDQSTIVNDPAF